MESCLSVEREHEKVANKLDVVRGTSLSRLKSVIDQVESLKERIRQASGDSFLTTSECDAVKDLAKEARDVVAVVSNDHKDIHASISKLGRTIDKSFQTEISGLCTDGAMFGEHSLAQLKTAIAEHLFREGKMEVGQALLQEASISLPLEHVEKFADVNRILEALGRKEVEPALEWSVVHRCELAKQDSVLEFKLRKLKFIVLVSGGHIAEALAYAKVFGQFAPQHLTEIKRLMGCFLYCHKGLDNSPYADLLDPIHWTEAADMFAQNACKLMGLPLESSLAVSLLAGCVALPQLLQLKQMMAQKQISEIWSRDELPCEVNLGWERRYHSVFTCPILRQQTSDANPPVRLLCGHTISRDAMKKLVSHSRSHLFSDRATERLKCPYCPVEMCENDVQQISF
ncbi:hypothetical protein EMCRGX_G028698 [Ephydatia muelleri]